MSRAAGAPLRPIVGRQTERALLSSALADARGGRTTLVLLSGELGIGKSTLVEDTAARAESEGFAVAWGRSWESGGAPPFWPWIQALRALQKRSDGSVNTGAALLAAELVSGTSRDGAATIEERFRLFDAVAGALTEAAANRPVALLLEDVHAADPASVQLLEFCATQLRGIPLAVVATWRELETRLSPHTSAALERVARNGRLVRLGPLSRDEAAQLVAPLGPDAQTVDWLHETTGGNPLFLTELKYTLTNGRLPSALPEGIRAAIRRHLQALPTELGPTLEAAAAIGRDVTTGLLAAATGVDSSQVAEYVDRAAGLGVLRERAPGRFAFSHSLIADTLHGDLPARRRVQLHLAIADTLERMHAADPDAPLAEIARHLFEAGPEAAARAVKAATVAAERARRQLAFEQAESLLGRALETLDAGAPHLPDDRVELLLALGRARMTSGRDDAGRAACLSAAELARTLGSAELLARAAVGYGYAFTFGVTDPVLVELLEEALHLLPDAESALRAKCLARLAAALQPAMDPRVPVDFARQAVAMARRTGTARERLEVFHYASAGLARFSPVAERAVIDQEALKLALREGDAVLTLRARARVFFGLIELGQTSRAWAHAEAYESLARQFRQPKLTWPGVMMRAMRTLFEGRFEEHAQHLAEAKRLAAEGRDDLLELCLINHRIELLRLRGDLVGLEEAVARFRALGAPEPFLTVSTSLVAARAGRLDEARRLISAFPVEALIQAQDTSLGTWAAETLVLLGDRARAEPLYAWLAGLEGQNAMFMFHAMAIVGPLSRVLCLLAAALGRLEDARRHHLAAMSEMEQQHSRPFLALLHLDWAEMLSRYGAESDRDEALRSASEARSMAQSLGFLYDARLSEIERRWSARPRAAATSPGSAVTLTLEGDSWIAEGQGGRVRLKPSRGVEMLARLIAEPRRELSALDLSAAEGPVDAGDAGEVIDAEAKRAYRARIRELEEELAEAESWNDEHRVARLREEADALKDELSRALGLGGRMRRVGAAQERARVNVQRRLADALRRVSEGSRSLGEHLQACVKTGAYCSYNPDRIR